MKQKMISTYFLCGTDIIQFVATAFLGGYTQIITSLHVGDSPNFFTIFHDAGGSYLFITILHRGEGSLGTPNSIYVINGRPLSSVSVL